MPDFVDGVTADFGTTSAVQKIVSQITLMYSVNQYFDFGLMGGCGIPAMEMLGSEEDWMKLSSKLKVLRTLFNRTHRERPWPFFEMVGSSSESVLESAGHLSGKPR